MSGLAGLPRAGMGMGRDFQFQGFLFQGLESQSSKSRDCPNDFCPIPRIPLSSSFIVKLYFNSRKKSFFISLRPVILCQCYSQVPRNPNRSLETLKSHGIRVPLPIPGPAGRESRSVPTLFVPVGLGPWQIFAGLCRPVPCPSLENTIKP